MSKTMEEQIKAIGEIMSRPDVPVYKFSFGKYKGETLKYVLEQDEQYLYWFYDNYASIPKKVELFLEQHVLKGYQ